MHGQEGAEYSPETKKLLRSSLAHSDSQLSHMASVKGWSDLLSTEEEEHRGLKGSSAMCQSLSNEKGKGTVCLCSTARAMALCHQAHMTLRWVSESSQGMLGGR